MKAPRLPQLLRYGTVSLVATTTSLVVLGLLVTFRWMTPGWANVVATSVGTIPSFELNRRWVWARRGTRSVATEVIPFAILSFAGLALSTLTVHVIGVWADRTAMESWARTGAVELANVAAFGSLWIAQFVILDHVLFADRHRRGATIAVVSGRPASKG
jgi:putative flippase GtrA